MENNKQLTAPKGWFGNFFTDFNDFVDFWTDFHCGNISDKAKNAVIVDWKPEEVNGEIFYKKAFFDGYDFKNGELKVKVKNDILSLTYDLNEEKHKLFVKSSVYLPSDCDPKTLKAKMKDGKCVVSVKATKAQNEDIDVDFE